MGREEIVGLIIDECRKRYGAGQVFYRGDGLAFEERRAAERAAYLQEHPETSPEYRELIEQGGVTPGMSRAEAIAAWGLIEEDMDGVGGRRTANEHHGYSYYYGFNVGRPYVLYLIDDTVVGVEENLSFYGTAWLERQAGGRGVADAPQNFPPGEWFAAVADGAPQFVAFRDINGETELVEAVWVKDNLFDILDHPLLVDGVSQGDRVEARWDEGDPTPRFLRVRRPSSQRTVRVRATEREVERFLHDVKMYKEEGLDIFAWGYRYERGVLVFGIYDFMAEDLHRVYHLPLSRLLPGEWIFTDTGTQE